MPSIRYIPAYYKIHIYHADGVEYDSETISKLITLRKCKQGSERRRQSKRQERQSKAVKTA